jgi:hypothetical protein
MYTYPAWAGYHPSRSVELSTATGSPLSQAPGLICSLLGSYNLGRYEELLQGLYQATKLMPCVNIFVNKPPVLKHHGDKNP